MALRSCGGSDVGLGHECHVMEWRGLQMIEIRWRGRDGLEMITCYESMS